VSRAKNDVARGWPTAFKNDAQQSCFSDFSDDRSVYGRRRTIITTTIIFMTSVGSPRPRVKRLSLLQGEPTAGRVCVRADGVAIGGAGETESEKKSRRPSGDR